MRYIKEIQGLRTVAAMLVAVYHIWLNRVSGGVDVFFVVSAFFMTRTLLKIGEAKVSGERVRRIRDYNAKTLRRVVPSAAVVIVVTIIASIEILAPSTQVGQWKDALASSLFVENWWLAYQSNDYLAQGTLRSPFQQFWALALQMQFYIVWPIIAAGAIWLAKARKLNLRKTLIVTFLVIAIASFTYATWLVGVDQAFAYYSTFARAWEFSAGSLLALLLYKTTPSGSIPWKIIGWVALGVLLSFAAVLQVSTLFPGPATLIPVGAAALLITAAIKSGQPAILRWRPLLWLAPMSFAFYLWHWPLLILWQYHRSTMKIGWKAGIAIIVIAWFLAWITTKMTEDPIRRSKVLGKSIPLTIAACVLLMVPAWAGTIYWRHSTQQAEVQISEVMEVEEGTLESCLQQKRVEGVITCTVGDATATTTVVAVGNSRVEHWMLPLDTAGKKNKFKVIMMTKAACEFEYNEHGTPYTDDETCGRWQKTAMEKIIEIDPDLVFTSISHTYKDNRPEKVRKRATEAMNQLASHDIPVVALRNSPKFSTNVPECLERNQNDPEACNRPRAEVYGDNIDFMAMENDHLTIIDYTKLYCPGTVCLASENGYPWYRDAHHFSKYFLENHGTQLIERDVTPIIMAIQKAKKGGAIGDTAN